MKQANGGMYPIGVLDSGVGGVSVLRSLRALMPGEDYIYYGDNANAPYGTRNEEEIRVLTGRVVRTLLDRGVKTVVIACNTATSAAAELLRERLDIPIVGMEPALKPAALRHKSGRIVVMATPATLRQRKFQRLMERYGQDAVMLPCPGLMEFAERGEIDSPALDEYLRERFASLQDTTVEAVVLGCTHYVFLREAIARVLPGAALYDGNEGTARRLQTLLAERGLENPRQSGGRVEFITSGEQNVYIPLMRRLLDTPCGAPALGLKRDTVLLRPHSAEWEERGRETVAQLRAALGGCALDVQHVGSTAVKGLEAKPVLDIAVGIRDLNDADEIIRRMERAGFVHRPKNDNEWQLFFAAGDFERGVLTHHVHVVQHGGERWTDYLRFRDALRRDEELREAYAKIKRELCARYPLDREAYTRGKADFVETVLRRCAQEEARLEEIISELVPLFHAGKLNCAEAALGILSRYWGCENDAWPRIATCFGGGICGEQGVCGAVTGALMAVGLRLGRTQPGGDKQPANAVGKALLGWVDEHRGTHLCRVLTGVDTSTPEGQQVFRAPGGAHERVCEMLVPEVCRYLARTL